MEVMVMPITQESTAENRESTELLNSRKKTTWGCIAIWNLEFWSCDFHLMKQALDQTLHLIQEDKSVLIYF